MAALRGNYQTILRTIPPGTDVLAVVKADAYGHGAVSVARELEAMNVSGFGVAFLEEGLELRRAGIARPILVMGGLYTGQEPLCIRNEISTAVFTIGQAQRLNETAAGLAQKARVHVKIDTGLGRLGVTKKDVAEMLRRLAEFRHLEIEGIFSQLASTAKLDPRSTRYVDQQVEEFHQSVREAQRQGLAPRHIHLANSAATLSRSIPFCNMVRPGLALYGAQPFKERQENIHLEPVMVVKSQIAFLKWVEPGLCISYGLCYTTERRTLVASVPVGYADGYPYPVGPEAMVLVRGGFARVIGSVCMDWLMIDVTDLAADVGDEVTLLGRDGAGNCIFPEQLAGWGGSIPNELFCSLSRRAPRICVNSLAGPVPGQERTVHHDYFAHNASR